LHNAHVTHDWGNNLITIEGNGTMWTIAITKHLDNNTKCPKVLLCYNLMEGVIDEEEKILLATKTNIYARDYHIITIKNSQCCNFWYKSRYKGPYFQLSTFCRRDFGWYYSHTYQSVKL
jgi:hypothetical protein